LRFFAYYLHSYENENIDNNNIVNSNSDDNNIFISSNNIKNNDDNNISKNNEESKEMKDIIFSSPDTQSSGMHQLESIGFKVRTLFVALIIDYFDYLSVTFI
jgi:hypothetical protein